MLKPENRVKLLLSGMENIDTLQQRTIAQAQQNIKDFEAFQKRVHLQFEKSIKEYKKMIKPLQEQTAIYMKQQQQMVDMKMIKPLQEQTAIYMKQQQQMVDMKMIKPLQEQTPIYMKQQQQMVDMYESKIKPIVEQVEKQTEEYSKLFKIDDAAKKMIADAVEVSQAIEGYSTVTSQQLQEEVAHIMKRYNVKISTPKE